MNKNTKYESSTVVISDKVEITINEHDYGFSGLPSIVASNSDKPEEYTSIVYVPKENAQASHFEITGYENGVARCYSTDCIRLLPAVLVLFVPPVTEQYQKLMDIFKAFVNVIEKAFPGAVKELGFDL